MHAWTAFKTSWVLPTALVHHLLKIKKEYKNFERNKAFNIYLSKRNRQSLLSTRHSLWRNLNIYGTTASDKVLCDKIFNINKNPKYDGYQRETDSIFWIKSLPLLHSIDQVSILM